MKKLLLSILITTIIVNNTKLFSNQEQINTTEKQLVNITQDSYRDSMLNLSKETAHLIGILFAETLNITTKLEKIIKTDPDAFQAQFEQKMELLIQKDNNAKILAIASSPFVIKAQLGEIDINTAIESTILSLEQNKEFCILSLFLSILDFIMPENEIGKFKLLWNKWLKLYSKNNNIIADSFNQNYYTKDENIKINKIFIKSITNNIKQLTKEEEWNNKEIELLDQLANTIHEYDEIINKETIDTITNGKDAFILNIVTKTTNLILNEIKNKLKTEQFDNEKEINKQLLLFSKKITQSIIKGIKSKKSNKELSDEEQKEAGDKLLNSKTRVEFLINLNDTLQHIMESLKTTK